MKKFSIALLISTFLVSPIYAQGNANNIISQILTTSSKNGVFTYHIPDDDKSSDNIDVNDDTDEIDIDTNSDTKTNTPSDKKSKAKKKDIVSDDITADTSGDDNQSEDETETSAEAQSDETAQNDDTYNLDDMYSYILKGSVSYDEDEENAVNLSLNNNQYLAVKINKPVSVKENYFGSLKPSESLFSNKAYTMRNGSEYSIKPMSGEASKTVKGGWSAGTTYNQGIDYGELEQSSGIYSKYQYKNFAISTSFAKTINSTNNDYNNNFYLSPEFAINQYFKIKSYVSVDTAKKRKKAEVSLSINPFGNKDTDRLNFEIGANETYDEVNNTFKNQFKFSTNFKF